MRIIYCQQANILSYFLVTAATHQHQALAAPLAVRPTPSDRDAMAYSVADTERPAYLRIDCERPMTTYKQDIESGRCLRLLYSPTYDCEKGAQTDNDTVAGALTERSHWLTKHLWQEETRGEKEMGCPG